MRAKVKAGDPSVSKKTAETVKNRGKRKTVKYKAFYDSDRTKDEEIERLLQRNKELENKLTSSEESVKSLKLQLAEKESDEATSRSDEQRCDSIPE